MKPNTKAKKTEIYGGDWIAYTQNGKTEIFFKNKLIHVEIGGKGYGVKRLSDLADRCEAAWRKVQNVKLETPSLTLPIEDFNF